MRVLDLAGHACDAGVPVTLAGQGLGPLDDPGLQARTAQVLPKDRAGVDAERVLTHARATVPIALPRDHLASAADPA